MSAGSPHLAGLPQTQDVLGELLHSLSQPLTSLRCSLELTIDEVAERQHEAVSVALQQTERVIGMIQLMRDYLEAEHAASVAQPAALAPALRIVVADLSSIAAARRGGLHVRGTCEAMIPVPAPQLRLALQYLIGVFIEEQEAGAEITLCLDEGSSGSVLRAESKPGSRLPPETSFVTQSGRGDPVATALRKTKFAIARRILQSAGASLEVGPGQSGFLLHLPRRHTTLGTAG